MGRWALFDVDLRTLRVGAAPVATLPDVPARADVVVDCPVRGSTLRLLPRDGRWALAGGARRVNGLSPARQQGLRHGDALTLMSGDVLVHDGRPPWPRLPADLEAAVVRARGAEAALRVYDDLLLEAGLDAAPASRLGVLEAAAGRGLEVDFAGGLPAEATLDLTSPLVARGLRRWCRALVTEPPFRFLRRVALVGPALANPRASSGWLLELVLALEASRPPLLSEVALSPLFDRANRAVRDRLERLVAVGRASAREPGHDEDAAEPDVRLFRPPAPSSWFHAPLPGEEEDGPP